MPGNSADPSHVFASGEHAEESDRGWASISVGSPDEAVTRMQLAARWAERFAAPNDSLNAVLGRFRTAYDYLDAVTHGMEPPPLEGSQPPISAGGPPPSPHAVQPLLAPTYLEAPRASLVE